MTDMAISARCSEHFECNCGTPARNRIRTVVIDEELPYPLNTGKRIRTYNLLTRLTDRFEISILCHRNVDQNEFEEARAHFETMGVRCHLVPRDLPSQSVLSSGIAYYGGLVGNLFSRRPYLVQKNDSIELRGAIEHLRRSQSVDVWHCEWTPYAAPFLESSDDNWVVSAHNIESQIWKRYSEHEKNPLKRWYIQHQAAKFSAFEQVAFDEAKAVVVVSDADADLAQRWFGSERPAVVENGVDLEYFRPGEVTRNESELLFLGSLDWRPNLDALRLLIDSIFPAVLAQASQAKLTVVGRKPPQWLIDRISRDPRIELHNDVADVRPFLHRAAALLVPLRIGGGSRLKILEALAAGCPVISTSVGAEGLDLEPGVDYIDAPAVEDFATTTVAAIRDYPSLIRTAESGQRVVQGHYDWNRLANRLGDVWEAQIRDREVHSR